VYTCLECAVNALHLQLCAYDSQDAFKAPFPVFRYPDRYDLAVKPMYSYVYPFVGIYPHGFTIEATDGRVRGVFPGL